MKIAYTFHRDAGDPRVQSGRPHSILQQFESRGIEVERIFPFQTQRSSLLRLRTGFFRMLGRPYRADREPALLRGYAREFAQRAEGRSFDLVFCPGSEAISQLRTDRPITFCADATFHNMVDYYWDFTELHPAYIRKGDALESSALQRAALAIYPSDWAARAAIDYYQAAREKVAVIPFGANFGRENSWPQVEGWIAARRFEKLKLLFLATHWGRKGGELVVETCRRLLQAGVSLELNVVGCPVPAVHRDLPWLVANGFLRPDQAADRANLEGLMRASHFLFLPTRAEAFGMSLCEANAFGVPVITTATGGVPSIVRDGENGFALPLAADAEAYAGQILRLFREPALYRKLAESSFREFERRLNWRAFCERYLELVEERLGIALRPNDSAAKPAAPSKAPALAKIGFLANDYINPESVSSWSGLPFYIAQGLRAAGYEVVPIRALGIGNSRWSRVKKALWRLAGRRYLPALEPAAMREYADVISGKISEVQPDLLFSLSSRFLVNLHVKVPTIFWTDATFAGMVDFYESFCRLTPATLANGRAAEQDALSRTSYAIYASDWAAQTAIEHYRVEPQKVRVVPFGANLSDEPKLANLEEAIARRKAGGGECRLLLMGVDWERKGASVAMEAAVELNRLGISTRLRVAGCRPPFRQKLPDCVELLGFLDKQSVAGRAQIAALYLESHFLIVPSRAEAYGVVFCEANAFGVPCLATEVGGIPTIIQNEVNGRLFDLHAHGREYAEWIADIWKDPARYQELALGSRRRYDERLCWSASIQQIAGLISTLLPEAAENERPKVAETLLQP